MRQQFLAHEMERACELDAEIVSVLHVAPARNTDFHKVTSPALKQVGETAVAVWKSLVQPPGRFISVSTEQLFGDWAKHRRPEMALWWEYIRSRYPWADSG